MVPVTPSPRRRVGYLSGRNTIMTPPRASPSGSRLGLLPPPLYHKNGVMNRMEPNDSPPMMVLSDKHGNRVGLTRSPHTFRPVVVHRDETNNVQSYVPSSTPPTSPFQRYCNVASPSPSLVSSTTTETSSDITMTPRSRSGSTSGSSTTSSFCTMSPSPTYFPFYRPSNREESRSPRKGSTSSKRKNSPR